MTEPVCGLHDFFLTRLTVEWFEPEKATEIRLRFSFDYDVAYNRDDPNYYRLTFRMSGQPDVSPKAGYEIDTEIVGYFSFPKETPKDQKEYLIRINGTTILYGILRGELASVTGMFPHGKITLPTVMMQDVIVQLEREKAENHIARRVSSAKKLRRKTTMVKKPTRSNGPGI